MQENTKTKQQKNEARKTKHEQYEKLNRIHERKLNGNPKTQEHIDRTGKFNSFKNRPNYTELAEMEAGHCILEEH